ncbi:hypothetical protein [Niallia circulans]|uniref:hypothetical protein n=1 Tax=Niallia circulans TaxID=1397 RepID=UPI0015600DB3|nr:hypothetical protein [Niallia circulans]NRG30727.1 hypothetical protein [Niallia circulans]
MKKSYVLKRDDGKYYFGHWHGQAGITDDLYKTPQYAERGAKSARGWLRDKERWSLVPITITIEEDAQ